MGQGMLNPMIVELGFTDTEFVAINKGVGFVALIVGSACGAPFIAWLGMGRALLVSGLLMMFSNLLFALLASVGHRSEEHTSELQSLMRISYAVFCLKKKKKHNNT